TKHNARKKKTPEGGTPRSTTTSDPKNGSEPMQRPAFVDHEARILGRARSSLGGYCYIYTHLQHAARDLIRHHKVADMYSELYTLARETTDQLALAKILQNYPEYNVLDAKRHVAQQRKNASQPMSATPTEPGNENNQGPDNARVARKSPVDRPS